MPKADDTEVMRLLAAGGVVVAAPRPAPRPAAPPGPAAPEGPAAARLAPSAPKRPGAADSSSVIDADTYERIKAGKVGYKSGNPVALPFATPGEMFLYFYPELSPHEWQLEEQHRLGGFLNLENPDACEPAKPTHDNPLIYNIVAANGSGKDTYIISPFAMWFVTSKIRSRCIVTSASQDQLKLQTFNYITNYAEKVNAYFGYDVFDIKEFYIYNNLSGSEIIGRVTNDPGKVEGFHPFESPPGAEMAVVINEAKTITDEVFVAFVRFTGYSYWLQISSPGTKSGQFYRSCSTARMDKCELVTPFVRFVTAFECPNISRAHIERVKMEHGEDSLIYTTSILAQFYSSSLDVLIPEALLKYPEPPHDTYGLEPAAGLDLAFSLDGDKSRFCIWHGNKELYNSAFQTESADKIHNWILDQLQIGLMRFGLKPENCYADGGGLGAPIISRVIEAGFPIVTRKNEFSAFNKNYYLNLGAEMYFRVKRLIEQRVLIIPPDEVARTQLTQRKAILLEQQQKWRLEPKQEAKRRLRYSPDRADAIVLALSAYPLDIMLSRPPSAQKPLQGGMTREQLASMLGDYAFNNVPHYNKPKPSWRGLNHEIIYASR